jgi:hypothetical protein
MGERREADSGFRALVLPECMERTDFARSGISAGNATRLNADQLAREPSLSLPRVCAEAHDAFARAFHRVADIKKGRSAAGPSLIDTRWQFPAQTLVPVWRYWLIG